MSNVNLYNAPAGNPGDITRLFDTEVVPEILGEAFTAFGVPYKYNGSGKAVNIAASDAATVFKGIISRSIPSMGASLASDASFAGGAPNAESAQGGVRKGFVNVLCKVGTPVKGGIVYMRVVADTGKLVGDLEATSDSTNSVVLPSCEWAVSGKDANNVTELYIKY